MKEEARPRTPPELTAEFHRQCAAGREGKRKYEERVEREAEVLRRAGEVLLLYMEEFGSEGRVQQDRQTGQCISINREELEKIFRPKKEPVPEEKLHITVTVPLATPKGDVVTREAFEGAVDDLKKTGAVVHEYGFHLSATERTHRIVGEIEDARLAGDGESVLVNVKLYEHNRYFEDICEAKTGGFCGKIVEMEKQPDGTRLIKKIHLDFVDLDKPTEADLHEERVEGREGT
jgi:hypothetical protein